MTQKILTRDFILCFFAFFAFGFVFNILIPTLPVYLSRLGSNEAEIGILIGSFAVFSLVLRPFVGKALLRIPEKALWLPAASFILSLLLLIFCFPFLAFFGSEGPSRGWICILQYGLTYINCQYQLRRPSRAKLKLLLLAFNLSSVLAPPLGMFLINHFTFTLLFLVCTGLSLCSLFVTNKLGRSQVTPLENPSVEDGFLLSRKALPPSMVGFFALFIWGALAAFFLFMQ